MSQNILKNVMEKQNMPMLLMKNIQDFTVPMFITIHVKNHFLSELNKAPDDQKLAIYWKTPVLGGPLVESVFLYEQCLSEFANMPINLETGGGIYFWKDEPNPYGGKYESMYLFTGGATVDFRSNMKKLYEKEDWTKLCKTFDEKPFKDNVCFKSTKIDGSSVYEQVGFQDKHTSRYINHKKPEFRIYNIEGEKYHGQSVEVNFKKLSVAMKIFEKGHPTKEFTQEEVDEYRIDQVGPKSIKAGKK